ncbi:uncharacterized protein EAE98_010083 [Botrytis deweyae]|uniref:Uncharacterized protein n=1 Tax=Botrytis deweyae TaxID=2478750 RepID=A0ABQ7I9Q5_9HELO|nr:uncharacterized protein EAE98_010083 [Botrytis deweyae]KAF7917667.1 hypothetical protein EAE98_010083 [Botrytis deweyae]
MVVGLELASWNSHFSLCAVHINGFTPEEMFEAVNIYVHDLRKEIGARRKPRVVVESIEPLRVMCVSCDTPEEVFEVLNVDLHDLKR